MRKARPSSVSSSRMTVRAERHALSRRGPALRAWMRSVGNAVEEYT
jgi:hypothetical protein